MSPYSLKCLGVGDGWPCPDRNHSAFLYRFDQVRLLIDCGEAVDGAYKAAGYGYDDIDRILLSHFHSDHFGGLFMLMQGFWLERRQKDLVLHLPGDGIGPLRQMLDLALLFEDLFRCKFTFEPWEAGRGVDLGGVRVTPYLTTHLDGFRATYQSRHAQRFEAFSFLLEGGGRRVAHTADLGGVEDLAPLLTRPVDLLVCELAHFRPEAVFEYLQGRSVGHTVFMHLARPYWERLPEIERLATEKLGGMPVTFAQDNQEFNF